MTHPTSTQLGRAAARALVRNTSQLRDTPHAADHARTIRRLAARLEHAIDNRPPSTYLGPCPAPAVRSVEVKGFINLTTIPGQTCGADLLSRLGEPTVTCTECGTTHDADQMWNRVTAAARDSWARPMEIVAFLRAMGHDITHDRLKMWISRDRAEHAAGRRRRVPYPPILQVGIDDADRPLYRVGDIIDRVEALAAIDERRRET